MAALDFLHCRSSVDKANRASRLFLDRFFSSRIHVMYYCCLASVEPCFSSSGMDSWSLRTIGMPTMPCMSWTERSYAESGLSSSMPGAHGETETATVGVTVAEGAVSAIYYNICFPLLPGARLPCRLWWQHFVALDQWVYRTYLFAWLSFNCLFSQVNHFGS